MPAGVGITPFSTRRAFVEERLHPIRHPPTTLQNFDKKSLHSAQPTLLHDHVGGGAVYIHYLFIF